MSRTPIEVKAVDYSHPGSGRSGTVYTLMLDGKPLYLDTWMNPDAERHANLFAAAPEMYEALKYIRENCFIYHDSSMDIDDEAGRLADAALAKAKGGSNVS